MLWIHRDRGAFGAAVSTTAAHDIERAQTFESRAAVNAAANRQPAAVLAAHVGSLLHAPLAMLGLWFAASTLAHAQQAAPAPAAPASGVEATLPAVIVTGEKTSRSLDRTAPSVKVFSARDLDSNPGLTSSRELLENTANVTASGTQNLAPAIRGIDDTGPSQGSDAFLAGTRSRLDVQVDGRAASFNEITFGDLGLWMSSRSRYSAARRAPCRVATPSPAR